MATIALLISMAAMFAAPILGVVWLVKLIRRKPAKKTGHMALLMVIVFGVFLFIAAATNDEGNSGGNGSNGNSEQQEQQKRRDEDDAPTPAGDSDIVVDGEVIYGFYDVMEEVGIEKEDAERIEKTDDWQSGHRYSFQAEGLGIRVYCNMDGTIHSVVAGSDVSLYLRGYETWTIDNFTVSGSNQNEMIRCAKEVVSKYLNYPSTAKFPLSDWSVSRYFDIYTVTGTVKAKNAFGVQSEMGFTVKFVIEDNVAKTIYCILDGFVAVDKTGDYTLPEREETGIEVEQPTDGSIRIYDGQLGEYGKKVQLDSYEYDWYMVPAGKYEAVSNVKTCTVYVDKNEITRNSDGYVEMENVATYTWEYGETIIIEVGEDEHLFNVYGADYTLTPIN